MAKKINQKTWPGAEVWPLERIKPYPNNPRTHPKAQIDLLAKLLVEHGPDQPIVVDENGVILKGHGRLLAATEAGLRDFPVFVRMGLSEPEKKAIRISDNAVALLSGWETELVRIEVRDLQLADYDLSLLGFNEKTLTSYLPAVEPIKNPNEVIEPATKPIVRVGDLWQLGDHRILCGDSTDAKAWGRLMGGQVAAMTFTDPPYGVSYEAASGDFAVIEGDHKRRDELYQMLVKSIGLMAKATSNTGAFYIWHASATRNDFAQAITIAGLVEKQYLIWAKPGMVLGRADYQWSHEPCFYCAHEGESPQFYGDRTSTTVWRVEPIRTAEAAALLGSGIIVLDGHGHMLYLQAKAPKAKKAREVRLTPQVQRLLVSDPTGSGTVWEVSRDSGYIHPTQKPVELATRAIENSSRPGDIVIDGFSGSGTTIIGCEMTGRRARAIDIDPKYVQAALERWRKFTDKEPTLDGRTLTTIAKERAEKRPGKAAGAPKRKRGTEVPPLRFSPT